jgi:3-oxoacyl-(acyl-carrier-protein) synthase/malonyl CoA-acyl carrier protein transacylase/acyl-CoA thioesterase FadM
VGFFAWPYRVLFSDAQAPDWHHFLANFRFQCEAREHLLFSQVLSTAEARAQCEDLLLVVHEGYSRNLAPVALGDTVGILMSYEEVTASSMRCCFRVVRSDGTPVACGFQKLVCRSRATGHVRPAPDALTSHAGALGEALWSPSFSERVLSGVGLAAIFDTEVVRLGRETATGARPGGFTAVLDRARGPLVFTFPPSVSPDDAGLLAALSRMDGSAPALLARAAEVTRDILGTDLTPLITDAGAAEHLRRHPELAEIAGPLAGLLAARLLAQRGARPDVVTGHGAGEIAAAAAAGMITPEAAVEALVHRVRALRPAAAVGGMRVVACSPTRVRAFLGALAPSSLEIALVDGPEETAVSGRHADLERLDALAAHFGIGCASAGAVAPLHSRLVADAVPTWTEALRALPWRAADRPMHSPVGRTPYPADGDMPAALAGGLVRPVNLQDALLDLAARGGRIFIECGAGRRLTGLAEAALGGTPGLTAVAALDPSSRITEALPRALEACGVEPVPVSRGARTLERAEATPIAVVGLGCVLPGAFDPEQLWQRVLETRTCLTDEPPYDVRAFLSSGPLPVPDKSYACLGGWARGFVPETDRPSFASVTQQHLAAALRQSLGALAGPKPLPDRVQVLLGSTGDGCREYDEALLLASLADPPSGGFDSARAARWTRALETAVGRTMDESLDTSPWLLYQAVAEELVGAGVRVLALDAACASALYALGTAVRALARGECDLAVAGGVFHPGAGNACLFAQFGGLSRTGSHPLDARADGVVFSEGTALLALKRLDDARAAGDEVHAVIRGVSWSSDGRSPSVMEPREGGQVLAMARAYQACGIDPASVQFLEAHATATPVGDAVEIGAATKVFPRGPAPLPVGSVKAVFGHTGWAAGATSAIKMIKGLEARTLPPQADFSVPNPRLAAEGSRFEVLTRARAWPDNGNAPRRAAINGFGFGGSNAHLLIEEFDATRPGPAATTASGPSARGPEPVAVVAAVPLLPARGAGFERSELSLPDSVLILPDVVDHMDRAQTLALIAGARALGALPGWKAMAEDVGVVLGIEGKTGRGVDASVRVFRDWLHARLEDDRSLEAGDREAFHGHVDATADRIAPSGPYTLLGLMPNVVAGRIANTFNLKGPNLVVDAHRGSLAAALELAAGWVESGERPLVLAGAIHASAHPAFASLVHRSLRVPESRPIGEAALLLALAPLPVAAEKGWPVLALLDHRRVSSGASLAVGGRGPCLLGAEGTFEIVQALAALRAGAACAEVEWPSGPALTFLAATPVGEAVAPDAMVSAANAGRTERQWPA